MEDVNVYGNDYEEVREIQDGQSDGQEDGLQRGLKKGRRYGQENDEDAQE